MRYSVCCEEMEGRWIAHVPSLWGCFSTAADRLTAPAALPATTAEYRAWRHRALWHERDHTQHILQFRARLAATA